MVTKLLKNLFAVSTIAVALSSCSGSDNLGMASDESIAKIKEVVKAHVDPNTYKIYHLEWKEDSGDDKLKNILSRINVRYIDKEGNSYDLSIEREDGEYVPGEADKGREPNFYSYELSTPVDIDGLNAENVRKMLTEGAELVGQQEGGDVYELKSVENVCFFTDPVRKSYEKRWDGWKDEEKASYKKVNQKFGLNFTKKDEHDQVIGKRIVTNYYTISFIVNDDGKVELKE